MCTCDGIIVPTKVFVMPHILEVKLDALVNHSLLRRRGSAVEQLVYFCTWKRPNRISAMTVKQPDVHHVVPIKNISYSLDMYTLEKRLLKVGSATKWLLLNLIPLSML